MAARRKKTTKSKSENVKLKRLEAQTRVICTFNRIIFAVMALVLGMAVVASALPQKRKLEDLQFQLARVQEEEKQVQAEKEYREIEYRAMKEDPEYRELKARDRLNLHREEERIFRVRRVED
jgi:septum formation inhibitor-activating ATPase MinD